jgi:hypothetical protein
MRYATLGLRARVCVSRSPGGASFAIDENGVLFQKESGLTAGSVLILGHYLTAGCLDIPRLVVYVDALATPYSKRAGARLRRERRRKIEE